VDGGIHLFLLGSVTLINNLRRKKENLQFRTGIPSQYTIHKYSLAGLEIIKE